jgi:hypothetical protein
MKCTAVSHHEPLPCRTKKTTGIRFVKLLFVIFILNTFPRIYGQSSSSLGWVGKEIIPLSDFVNKNKWEINASDSASGYITTDSSFIYLHWKIIGFGANKFVQCYQRLSTPISLANKDIFSFDIKGSKSKSNKNVTLKFEKGIQTVYQWKGLAGITRWCESVSALKQQFSNLDFNWSTVNIISLDVNNDGINDSAADSGVVAFRKLQTDSIGSWKRTNTFETTRDSSILPGIISQTVESILGRQNNNTGLFATWLYDHTSELYGQALALKILALEGTWKNGKPIDSCAKAVEKLALFLVKSQAKQGFWPKKWDTQTGKINAYLEEDNTVYMTYFPWIITGLQNYYNKSGDIRVKITIDKAKSFLYNLIEKDSILYTINPLNHAKWQVTDGKAYASVILSLFELGDSIKARKMLQYIDQKLWDNDLKYWKESFASPRIELFANTWLSLLTKKNDYQKPLDALSVIGKALFTKGPGAPGGFDDYGPIATSYEGTLSYICAGGPGSNGLFYDLIKHRYADNSLPYYNDSVCNVAGIWAVKWSNLNSTAWLYFAASQKSPFDVIKPTQIPFEEPKKVLMHYMGWYGDSLSSNYYHWKCGEAYNPLIGKYDSRNWSLLTYHMLLSWSCGIDGLVMNLKDDYDDQSLKALISAIKRIRNIDSLHFKYNFAVDYDDQGFDKVKPLDTAVQKITQLHNHVLANTKSYLHYYDKPAVFVFNYPNSFLSAGDYKRTLNNVFDKQSPMLLWPSMESPEDSSEYIDAFYPWVQTGDIKDYPWNGVNWGEPYLNYFYQRTNTLNADSSKLSFTCGGVWPGYDERKDTCWGNQIRWIDRTNGNVYNSTWSLAKNYSGPLPLKWVMIENWNNWNDGLQIEPSKEYGYQYLKSTIDQVNAFKGTNVSKDTCKFEAAREIYKAAYLIEHGFKDSTVYYPILQHAIRFFLVNDCETVIARTRLITELKELTIPKTEIEIYPNPATSQLYIKNEINNHASVQLYNCNGQKLLTKQLNNQLEAIDISQFSRGVYLLKIIKNNSLTVRKVIFQ